MIDETLAELAYAALTDWRAAGPLGDWFEERGHDFAASHARRGRVFNAIGAIDPMGEFYDWLEARDPGDNYRERRSYPPLVAPA